MAVLLTFLVVGVLVALVVAIYAANRDGLGEKSKAQVREEIRFNASEGYIGWFTGKTIGEKLHEIERQFRPAPSQKPTEPTLADRLAALEAKRGAKS